MSLILADRVQETTATTGTGTLTLAGAVAQYQAFHTGIGSGNTTYYALISGNGTDWETGLGTIGGSGPYTLSRSAIISSSNSNSAISLSGTSTVFCDLPASIASPGTPGNITQVQSANAQNYSASPYTETVTFGSTPTVGNLLVFMCGGWKGGWTPPAGVVPLDGMCLAGTNTNGLAVAPVAGLVYGDTEADNQQVQFFTRIVQPGDGAAWAFGINVDVFNILALELSGVGSIRSKCINNGWPAGTSATLYAPLVQPEVAGELVWVIMADDTTPSVTAPSGYTTQATMAGGVHAAHQITYCSRNSSPTPGTMEAPGFVCTSLANTQSSITATIRFLPVH